MHVGWHTIVIVPLGMVGYARKSSRHRERVHAMLTHEMAHIYQDDARLWTGAAMFNYHVGALALGSSIIATLSSLVWGWAGIGSVAWLLVGAGYLSLQRVVSRT